MILICINFAKFRDARIVMANDASGVRREGVFIPLLQNGFFVSKKGHPWLAAAILRVHEPITSKATHAIFLRPCLESIDEMLAQGLVDLRNVEKTGLPLRNCVQTEPIGYAYPKVEKDGRTI